MCTVTWLRGSDGYEVLFNRDEKRTRQAALSPLIFERDGTRFIAPVDRDRGGTWIAVNEAGITCCLLNGAGSAARRELQSRGLIPLSMIAMQSRFAIQQWLEDTSFEAWAPFTLLILSVDRTTLICRWSGEGRTIEPGPGSMGMLTSSSLDTERVLRCRQREFQDVQGSAAALDAYHRSHAAPSKAHAVCMHRPDAKTVSLSRVHVGGWAIEFRYQAGSPCKHQPAVTIELAARF
jgi:uncharacterized protein with NRDE domain